MTTPDLEDWTALPHGLLAHAHERVAELEAEVARLREALAPFATYADAYRDIAELAVITPKRRGGPNLRVRHFRAAAAALRPMTTEE